MPNPIVFDEMTVPSSSKPSNPSPNGNRGAGHLSSPPTIRRGSQGMQVAYCQNLLNARLTLAPLWVDGLFGLDTEFRVRQFQAARRLQIDGIVGPETWAALELGPPPIKRRPATA